LISFTSGKRGRGKKVGGKKKKKKNGGREKRIALICRKRKQRREKGKKSERKKKGKKKRRKHRPKNEGDSAAKTSGMLEKGEGGEGHGRGGKGRLRKGPRWILIQSINMIFRPGRKTARKKPVGQFHLPKPCVCEERRDRREKKEKRRPTLYSNDPEIFEEGSHKKREKGKGSAA